MVFSQSSSSSSTVFFASIAARLAAPSSPKAFAPNETLVSPLFVAIAAAATLIPGKTEERRCLSRGGSGGTQGRGGVLPASPTLLPFSPIVPHLQGNERL